MKKILRKMAYAKEPKLQVHKYVVAVSRRMNPKGKKPYVHTKYFYCVNLKEVTKTAKAARKGSWVDVFIATHNFIQGYAQE